MITQKNCDYWHNLKTKLKFLLDGSKHYSNGLENGKFKNSSLEYSEQSPISSKFKLY